MECPRIAPERTQVTGLAADWKAYPHFFMGTGTSTATHCQELGRNRGDQCYTVSCFDDKMEIPVKFLTRWY